MKKMKYSALALLGLAMVFTGCNDAGKSSNGALSSSAAEKVYVAPGNKMNSTLSFQEDIAVTLPFTVFHLDGCLKKYPFSRNFQLQGMGILKKPNLC